MGGVLMQMEKHVLEANVVVLRPLERRLYTTTARHLKQELESFVEVDGAGIVLNLQGVELIDRSGLRTILSSFKRLDGAADFVLCCVSQAITELLKITKNDKLLHTFVSEDEAVAFLKKRNERRLRTGQVRFLIESNLNEISLVGITVHALCSAIPLSDVDSYQIEMCVVEAVNNAIEHAYNNSAGKPIEIKVLIDIDKISLMVRDEGCPMHAQGEAPALEYDPDDLDTLPEGGMGLYLIDSVMDEVLYQTDAGSNTLTMIKML